MKTIIKLIFSMIAIALCGTSCTKPRISMDDTVYGDKAYITAAVLFKNVEITNQLGYNQPVTGYQSVAVATQSNTIDNTNYTVNLVAVKGTDLTKIGIRFSHTAEIITPLEGVPPAGVIADFSKGKFIYRVLSADGTVRDWTVLISVVP